MFALKSILDNYRSKALSEREKGTYFERLIRCYFKNEPCYEDLFSDVWMYSDWARKSGLPAQDTGIDLVARTRTDELVAIQCKLHAEDHTLQKKDIDSFFTASGKSRFARRIIVSSTNQWSRPAEDALADQVPPVTKIDLEDLEHSRIDWSRYEPLEETVPLRPRKTLREHQIAAVRDVLAGLANADRGKLIMACGTGKTFTSLKIAEQIAGRGGRVLFLVPSLSLLSQILTEWTQETELPMHAFAVCSDSDVGKKRSTPANDDDVQTLIHELKYPATTDAASLARAMARVHDPGHLSVVFSTYHSIEVLGEAQARHGLPAFDLIVCDEAHRTTGAIFENEDESAFVRVHDAGFIHARKRLYMTATPRIYGDAAKVRAESESVTLCSMDDPALYGPTLHTISFSRAVQLQLLVDYKVIVLAVEESHVSRRLQALLSDDDNQLKVTDAAKIVGCWKALGKRGLTQDLIGDAEPMRRAVAFCQVIRATGKARYHQVASETIAAQFQAVVDAYQEQEEDLSPEQRLRCEAAHVDGSMNAGTKEAKLRWLKDDAGDGVCRILSNVRCLSEGVDVPALDAVLFLTPRNSQVDVVQSVGRVMRLSPGKKRGYVILPVVIPAGLEPHEALADNKTYAVVWQVLQALRSHDDRFDAMINKMDLELNRSMLDKIEVVAIADDFARKAPRETPGQKALRAARTGSAIGAREREARYNTARENQLDLDLHFGEIERAIYARIVQKCGNRHHWEDWANDIAAIARTHIDRITGILENPQHAREREAFQNFADELRDDLNDAISDAEVIEMLAQHLITRPVFDALFSGYSFAAQNPISQAMQAVLDALDEHRLDKEADTLEQFYESVRFRAAGIDNAAGKQKIVVELYDKFFRNAFPRMTERLGIVYTPVEVVDFILHSVDALLRQEFNQTLGSPGVHIIDPFTGTGTFITRLLQSGLIAPEELPHKYLHEIHANEIVLLAYYIAAINIEATFHSLMYPEGIPDMMPRVGAARSDALPGVGGYTPFPGICLTDTFQLYEKDDLISRLMVDNSDRRTRQKNLDIRVIIGNPPYSAGQGSANDNNQNVAYPNLDERIEKTYASRSEMTSVKNLYDSYIRAIRWASDRIGTSGIIGFVTNAGFIETNSADGLRKCLAEEFSSIYIFHLRGNQRTSGEQSRKEGGKIFGSGSRAPIAITFLVKNTESAEHGKIYFHNIGDYLTREDKLARIKDFGSIQGIHAVNEWTTITPDFHGDWLRQRDDNFQEFFNIGSKKNDLNGIFNNYSQGVLTSRDAWCYNFSNALLSSNMEGMIGLYNQEVKRFYSLYSDLEKKARETLVSDFINKDTTKISWSSSLIPDVVAFRKGQFFNKKIVKSLYRPFSKQWLYYDDMFNHRLGQMPRIFSLPIMCNLLICVSGKGAKRFSAIISDNLIDFNSLEAGAQCFPLYLYDEPESSTTSATAAAEPDLFSSIQSPVPIPQSPPPERRRRSALTDAGLAHFQAAYPGETLTKEDIFYYVYGLLHSPDYRARYADNLSKELPRIPCVKSAADFWAFSRAGRRLADLHINYETVDPYPATVTGHQNSLSPEVFYRVEKMKYAKKGDKTTLIYNSYITISEIPLEAYEYVVNGKPALDWVVERQCVKTDKDSGIVNDANAWALETMHNPRYPLDLFLRVITVSLETMKLVNALPGLEI